MTHFSKALRYTTGLQSVTANVSAYLQPDGHYGLNNAAVFWTSEGAVLVDTAFDIPRTRKLVDAITHANHTPNDISALILTHNHGDHSYGACVVPTARLIMADEAVKSMREAAGGLVTRLKGLGVEAQAMLETLLQDNFDFTGVKMRLPSETFSGETTLEVGERKLRLLEFRDIHTTSDSIVVDEAERVAVTGDLMFADSHIPLFGPHSRRWAQVMERFLELDVDTFIPGHGRLCDRDDVREHRDYLLWLYDCGERAYRRGLTPEEAANELIVDLGPYAHLQRADILLNSLDVLYCEIAPDRSRTTYEDSLAQRWRFRMRWRGCLPGICEPLSPGMRLKGFLTLSQLNLLEEKSL